MHPVTKQPKVRRDAMKEMSGGNEEPDPSTGVTNTPKMINGMNFKAMPSKIRLIAFVFSVFIKKQ
jgi:hypothetical protein